MRSTTSYLALALVSVWLAGCSHRRTDTPLAYVPDDTPYVLTNLKPLDDDTREALLARADAALPGQLEQLRAMLPGLDSASPQQAGLLDLLSRQVQGKSIERFSQEVGVDLQGKIVLYGLGLSPVLRLPLRDPRAFSQFMAQLQSAYGQPIPGSSLDGQAYHLIDLGHSGTQLLVALRHDQAILAILPQTADAKLLGQALGLRTPSHSLWDSRSLSDLAKAKGYHTQILARLDTHRLLGLIAGGHDPLLRALLTVQAGPESRQTGEPVDRLISIPPSCGNDARRIADRIPQISFGYTRLDAHHQDVRWDIGLADDITQTFTNLPPDLPGLGADAKAAFDLQAAVPVAEVRNFLQQQVDAVTATPFTCPTVADLNTLAKRLAILIQQLGVPPIGQLRGLRLVLDRFDSRQPGLAGLSGRAIIGSQMPDSLISTAQLFIPSTSSLRIQTDSHPVSLPDDLLAPMGQPGWIAASSKAVAIGIGAGENSQLPADLIAPTSKDPILGSIHLSGAMYRNWVQLAELRAAQSREAMPDASAGEHGGSSMSISALAASSQAQIASMRAQADRIDHFDARWWMEPTGLVISNQITLH
ncbi:hypothetical protein [Frateuria aurantia]|uniref:Lipoprotein n=1 Tax=Frateuria aurantia (strain ATCC 33424 / DSM 6220 / KCTC 2777 / LMG 1558 / NBRC 3245 / NCIMB 13370) TaxID=767434 RepID=H8L5P3_FRAAD|nr:hypothetical protein [Frateuria aurantia]AFC86697.1 hypothetical protein Fraau_2329 [Frateuria aurantia DSM 6220]